MTVREAVASALTGLKIDNGEGGQYWLVGDLLDFSGENQARIIINALADAALAAARPYIREECAKVLDEHGKRKLATPASWRAVRDAAAKLRSMTDD